jgi:hypothetical protein
MVKAKPFPNFEKPPKKVDKGQLSTIVREVVLRLLDGDTQLNLPPRSSTDTLKASDCKAVKHAVKKKIHDAIQDAWIHWVTKRISTAIESIKNEYKDITKSDFQERLRDGMIKRDMTFLFWVLYLIRQHSGKNMLDFVVHAIVQGKWWKLIEESPATSTLNMIYRTANTYLSNDEKAFDYFDQLFNEAEEEALEKKKRYLPEGIQREKKKKK